MSLPVVFFHLREPAVAIANRDVDVGYSAAHVSWHRGSLSLIVHNDRHVFRANPDMPPLAGEFDLNAVAGSMRRDYNA